MCRAFICAASCRGGCVLLTFDFEIHLRNVLFLAYRVQSALKNLAVVYSYTENFAELDTQMKKSWSHW